MKLSSYQKGYANEILVAAYFAAQGYSVIHTGPHGGHTDLLIQKNKQSAPVRVQVKTATPQRSEYMGGGNRTYLTVNLDAYPEDAFDLLVAVRFPDVWVFDAKEDQLLGKSGHTNLVVSRDYESPPQGSKTYDAAAARDSLRDVLMESLG